MKKIILALGAIYVLLENEKCIQFDYLGEQRFEKLTARKSGVVPKGEEITQEAAAEMLNGKRVIIEGDLSHQEVDGLLKEIGVTADIFVEETPVAKEDANPESNPDVKSVTDTFSAGVPAGEDGATKNPELSATTGTQPPVEDVNGPDAGADADDKKVDEVTSPNGPDAGSDAGATQ